MNNPVPGPAGPGVPAGGTGTPRGEGDGIAVEVPTRAGLVTVVFTGREHARACPAGRAFTYRDRQYAGSVYLAGPDWQGTALLGLSLYPAGRPAGPAVAGAIASIIGPASLPGSAITPRSWTWPRKPVPAPGGPGRGATWNC